MKHSNKFFGSENPGRSNKLFKFQADDSISNEFEDEIYEEYEDELDPYADNAEENDYF